MKKTGKTLLIFLLILVQSLMAMTAGIVMLFSVSQKEVPANVYAGEIDISEKGYNEAAQLIEADYGARFDTHALRLSKDDEIYEIPFSAIEAAIDGEMTIKPLNSIKGPSDLPRLVNTYFGRYGTVLNPVVHFNESKLRMELIELSERIDTAPTDAGIYYKDGLIEKIPDNPGISLNVNNTTELIRAHLSSDPFETIDLNNGGALKTIDADVQMRHYESIQVVLGEYSTSISDAALSRSIQLAVEAINGLMIAPSGDETGRDKVSFVECMSAAISEPNYDEGYSQVASTLYAALLKAGLPKDSITARVQHKLSVDYIEPGLDSWISSDAGDLRFSNPYKNTLAIFAVMQGSVLTVAVAGSREDKTDECVITKEIVQEFSPPVYFMENENLKPGERVILDPGKDGITVKVYRNEELISTDSYEAESSIVQIPPDTEWENKNK